MTRHLGVMDEKTTDECLMHIRAAARLCDDAGMLVAWATLLGVADDIAAASERRVLDAD